MYVRPFLFALALWGVIFTVLASTEAYAGDVPTGCLASYHQGSIGQSMLAVTTRYADAEVSRRSVTTEYATYHERVYALCEPTPPDHQTLTVRFVFWQGRWVVNIADTHIGPEDDRNNA